jgi:hypothetical protein
MESFKGPGIEAKTRAVVQEAKSTITELQSLTAELGFVLFELIDGGGRWGGNRHGKERQKERLRAAFDRVGLTERQIAEATAPEWEWAANDYALGAVQEFSSKLTADSQGGWSAFITPYEGRMKDVDPAELLSMMEKFGVVDQWRKELIQDFRYVKGHKKHRRPEIWHQHEQWWHWTQQNSWPT